jgi:hypothetical protein
MTEEFMATRIMLVIAVLSAGAVLSATTVLADGGPNHRVKQALPIKLGTSGGSAKDSSRAFCCGGTLGAAVLCNGTLQVLSNNHVLGRSGSATIGEDAVQPGLIDSGCKATTSNVVADYAGNLVPLGTANVDAAVSTARAGAVTTTGEILDIGVPCTTPANAAVGMAVAKSGRTTGFTSGTVQAVNLTVSIQYQTGCNSGKKLTISYANQVSVTPGTFIASGDSGSLLVTNDANHQPVGLLFAGSSSVAIANPVQDLIDAFTPQCGGAFSFVGGSCVSSASSATIVGPTSAQLGVATMVKERHVARLMSDPAVLGVGVGAADDDSNQAVLIVYLQEGRRHRALPGVLDGLRVKIVLTDPIVAMGTACR